MSVATTMIETLRDFVTKVEGLGIDYMVTGSYAMSAYGEIRMTRDIDIVIQLTSRKATQFFELFKDEYYISENSVARAIEKHSMFNIVSLTHGGKLDCIIRKDTPFARTSFQRRYLTSVAGFEYWVTSKEDLVIAKLQWARDTLSEMQLRDIANMTSSEYDFEYVAEWIRNLELETVWSAVEKWKTQRENQGE